MNMMGSFLLSGGEQRKKVEPVCFIMKKCIV